MTPSLRTSDINLQHVSNTLLKATFSKVELSDELVQVKTSTNANMPVNRLIEESVDAIALLSHASQELNQRRRDNIEPVLPIMCHWVQLSFFGDDIRKLIQDITATSMALGKSAKSSQYKHPNHQRYSKNFQVPQKYPSCGKRGPRRGRQHQRKVNYH